MSDYRAHAEDIVRDWHDDPASGEDDLVRRIAALCEIARNEGVLAERARIYSRGRVHASVPRDEYEETVT